jgi:hypothetical protein
VRSPLRPPLKPGQLPCALLAEQLELPLVL